MNKDNYSIMLDILGNSTKLGVVFLLMRNERMTVTQMSDRLGVTKAYLYHFVSQMAKDNLLSKPEPQVRGNYVEKYYRLNWKIFASIDPVEQKRRLRSMKTEEQRQVLESFLASLGLHFRLFAEEVAKADSKTLGRIGEAFQNGRIAMTYVVLPDKIYDRAIREVRKVMERISEEWGKPNLGLRGNRLVVVGIPQLEQG